jgi:CheY-like chemotaxis protein
MARQRSRACTCTNATACILPSCQTSPVRLKTVRPDVGIIDISAPLVDRARVARRFRRARHGRNMVLVALGLPASPSAANGSSKDGFDYHLAKPVDAERLAMLLGAGDTQTGAARQ